MDDNQDYRRFARVVQLLSERDSKLHMSAGSYAKAFQFLSDIARFLPEEMMAAVQAREEVQPKPERRAKSEGAYSGGACSAGKRVGGAAGKTPLIAAVETVTASPPRRLKLKTVNSQGSGMLPASVLRRLFINLTSEPIRIVSMQLVLTPAAYLLPRSWALAVANVLSLLLVVLPSPGMVTYARMRRAFGEGRLRSFQLAWGSVARPYKDFVTLKRVLYGREDVSGWKIIERNSDEVASLRDSGQSFIVATAHFARAALLAIACPSITPGNLITVGHPPPAKIRSPFHLRLRIQYGTMLKALSSVWRRPGEFAFTGSSQSAASLIYERLRKPGNIVSIHVDAPWPKCPKGSYSRPFAGLRDRTFSTGAAQLAALTRCPIVTCVYWQQDDETVIVEWGSPIRRIDDETDTIDDLLDKLEAAVGERPMQYMLDIGGERRWNEARKRWEDLAP